MILVIAKNSYHGVLEHSFQVPCAMVLRLMKAVAPQTLRASWVRDFAPGMRIVLLTWCAESVEGLTHMLSQERNAVCSVVTISKWVYNIVVFCAVRTSYIILNLSLLTRMGFFRIWQGVKGKEFLVFNETKHLCSCMLRNIT